MLIGGRSEALRHDGQNLNAAQVDPLISRRRHATGALGGIQNHHGLTECGSLEDAVSLLENRLISRCPNQVRLRKSAKAPASDMGHGYPGFWVAIGCALILALSTDEPQQQLAWSQTLWLHHQLSTTGRLSTVV